MRKQLSKLNKNKSGIVGIIIVIILAVAIIAGVVVVFVIRGGPFTLIGETDYTYESTTNLNLTLYIDNNVGSVSIEYDDSLTSLMEARLEFWGRSEANIADAANFTSSTVGDNVIIEFDSDEPAWRWNDKKTFYQKLFIKINPDAIAIYEIHVTTGNVDLDFDSLTESVILLLDVGITTGTIEANFGDNTFLNLTEVILTTITGNIEIFTQNLKFTDDILWSIWVSTGSVELTIGQDIIPADNYSSTYDVTVTTGSINVFTFIDESDFGIRISAQVTTGNIQISGGGSLYESPDYASKSVKYIFDLATVTGSITAS